MKDVTLTADGPRLRGFWGTPSNRESPPVSETPAWARPLAPEWDEAARTLFSEEYARADVFWDWLTVEYRTVRARLWGGYRYLEGLAGRDDEAEDQYGDLCVWFHWLEASWWLLSQWHAPENQCRSLWLPLPVPALEGKRVVQEYRGLKGEVLLEEALRLWRDYSILTHQLPDVGEAPALVPPAEPEPPAAPVSLRPVTQRTVGTATLGGRRIDEDLGKKPDLQAMSQLPATPKQVETMARYGVTDNGDGPWPPIRKRAAELIGDAIAQKKVAP